MRPVAKHLELTSKKTGKTTFGAGLSKNPSAVFMGETDLGSVRDSSEELVNQEGSQ